jgi:DNA ligase-1
MEFPTLYGNVSRGDKIKMWNIRVLYNSENNTAQISRSYGQLDGKQTNSVKEITKGKNVGRSNETTVLQQACNEAQSLWNKQKECGYIENKEDLTTSDPELPMLAHDFTKRGKSINIDSAIVQPKIDGVRMMVTKTKKTSRTGKLMENLIHLDDDLQKCFALYPNIVLDGELFTFDLPFEDISGCARQTKNVNTEKVNKLQYYVFDCYFPDETQLGFQDRFNILNSIFSKYKFSKIILVETEKLNSTVDVMHEKYINEGYEGLMVRNSDGKYKLNYRSVDLQKYKCFTDDEYTIIDVKEASGNDKGTAIFVCKDKKSNETFSVRPRGSRELRSLYWNESQKFINKQLTVRFQNLTENGLPRFPVGIAIRDYE